MSAVAGPEHIHDEHCIHDTNQTHYHDHSYGHELRGAHPTSLPAPITKDEDPQNAIKSKIREIQSSKSLTPKEKADSVQKLMMKSWTENQEKLALTRVTSDSEVERRRVTYHVSES